MASPLFNPSDNPRGQATELSDDYNAIKRDIASLSDSVKKLASDQIGPAVAGAQDQVMQKLGDVESSIRKNPTQAALIAVGVGFVAGLILSR